MIFPSHRTRQRLRNATAKTRHAGRVLVKQPRYDETKVFCVGRNKTGTTSIETALRELGFTVGDQRYAELLADDYYHQGNFQPIIRYCAYANAFQDIPFSWPRTYQIMDAAFPNALFVLTVRDSPERWYESMIRFQAKRYGQNGELPTDEDLKRAEYVRPGFPWRSRQTWDTQADDLYDRDRLIAGYIAHNEAIKKHFANRPDKLITINVSQAGEYARLCRFLGVTPVRDAFPWKNRN